MMDEVDDEGARGWLKVGLVVAVAIVGLLAYRELFLPDPNAPNSTEKVIENIKPEWARQIGCKEIGETTLVRIEDNQFEGLFYCNDPKRRMKVTVKLGLDGGAIWEAKPVGR